MSAAEARLLGEPGAAAAAPPVPPAGAGNAFEVAWSNYMKSVFKKGFMCRLSCSPSMVPCTAMIC